MRPILDRFIQRHNNVNYNDIHVQYMQYGDFDEITEIGAGGYGTVYTAKYRKYLAVKNMPKTVALKRFKSIDEAPELFISEVSKNNW